MTDPTPLETLTTEAEETTTKKGRSWQFWVGVGIGGAMALCLVLFLVALGVGVASGSSQTMTDFVAVLRDMFIILLALQGLVIGVALIVLIVQLAALLNILQNEISPIVDGAREAVGNVKGTTEFVGKHVTDPIIKGYAMATGARQFMKEASGIQDIMNMVQHKDDPTASESEHDHG